MTTLFIVLALVVALLLFWVLRSRAAQRGDTQATDNLDTLTGWPPQATRVLTTAERQAYDVLRSALPAHMILAQVPLQRFIKVPTRNSYAEWLRRVGQLNADLVVCDRHSQVIAVVEIEVEDDQPGGRAQRRRQRMLRVLKNAQIPVHVWPASTLPSPQAAREAIDAGPAGEELPAAAAPGAVTGALPGRFASPGASPANEAARQPAGDEETGMREPPPSTWFDDLDSAPAPLTPQAPKETKETKSRPGR